MPFVEIGLADPREPDIQDLLSQSDEYHAKLYPPESNHLLDPDTLAKANVGFYVARIDGKAQGCGAVVAHDSYAELKRMYVDPGARGNGIGKQLLTQLEQHAREKNCSEMRLETGIKQPEAIHLYTSFGYRETPPFGDYKHDPLSLFMRKSLVA